MDQTTILNMALHHLGMEPIVSITDLNPSAKVLNDFWIPARDDTFSEHQWPFADAQIPLQLLSASIIGWSYVYGYPVNVARVWTVYNEGSVKWKHEREFEKKYLVTEDRAVICSNEDLALADVTYIIPNVSIWDSKFCIAHSLKMAALACPDLLGDQDKAAQLSAMAGGVINEAKRTGASEQHTKPNQDSVNGSISARGN